MKYRYLLVALLVTGLGACGFHKTPEQQAQWFFDKGEKSIIKSLKKQDADDQKIDLAQDIIQRHEGTVTQALEQHFNQQRTMFTGLIAGKDSQALASLEGDLHSSHLKVLAKIGGMHEELEQAVGSQLWQQAGSYREQKMRKHLHQ